MLKMRLINRVVVFSSLGLFAAVLLLVYFATRPTILSMFIETSFNLTSGSDLKFSGPHHVIVEQFPLHIAAAGDDAKTLSNLLSHGADVNALNETGETPLHMASQGLVHGLDAMKILIEYHANVNARDSNDETPLLFALSTFGSDRDVLPIATFLINNGADVNACDLYNKCPLATAYREGLLDVALLLLQKNANPNSPPDIHYNDNILHMVASQTPEQFQNQFNQQISGQPNGRGNTWPEELKNQISFVAFLIQKGADVNVMEGISKTTPLMIATQKKNDQLVEFLKSKGAKFDGEAN